jgi:hypothetical protein
VGRPALRILLLVAGILAIAFPASASAVSDPQQVIGGAGSKWFSGSLIQQTGENCSIIGNPYTEVMVSGVGSYGGAPGNDVPRVGQPYWVDLLVSIPGNPCGTGSSSVATDLVMPAGTSYDPSRPIRCFGTNRFSGDFFEVTNQTWNFLGQSGRYCPTGPTAAPIGQRFGFRPLANGQMFEIFVPVVSTQTLHGAGGPDEFNWLTNATGVYANPYRSYIWANVFPAANGVSGPFVYFDHDPAAIPFWDANAPTSPTDLRNKVEFFANVYTDGHGGYLHYSIERTDTHTVLATDADDTSYDGTVSPGTDVVQVKATGPNAGPNGGYVPFAYPGFLGVPMKITWDFTYNGTQHATNSADFTTLAGPDSDGDGVPDASDQCPTVKGTLPNGCLPGLPDLKGGTGLKRGTKLRRSKLASGMPLAVTCTRESNVSAVLTMTRTLAKKLGIPGTKIGSGHGSCTEAGGGSLKLKLTGKASRKLRASHKTVPATLTLTFTTSGSPTSKVVLPVKVG